MASSDIKQQNQRVLKSLKEGDMVEFPRGLYSHWGVYVGDGQIVHLTGAGQNSSSGRHPKAVVCKDNFWDVLKGCIARKNNDKDSKLMPLSASKIVQNAIEMIGHEGYNVLRDNCEHFAALCRYGEKWSEQADKALTKIVIAGGVATLIGLLWGVFKDKKDVK